MYLFGSYLDCEPEMCTLQPKCKITLSFIKYKNIKQCLKYCNSKWDLFSPSAYIIKLPVRARPSGFMFITYSSNCYSLRSACASNLLFSTLCPTPFHHVKMYFGALHNHSADVTRSDTPSGCKPPHL